MSSDPGRDPDKIKREAEAEVRRRLVDLPFQPEKGFDPINASPDDLDRNGVVPDPGEQENPDLYELWKEALSGSATLDYPQLDHIVIGDYVLQPARTSEPAAIGVGGDRPQPAQKSNQE